MDAGCCVGSTHGKQEQEDLQKEMRSLRQGGGSDWGTSGAGERFSWLFNLEGRTNETSCRW